MIVPVPFQKTLLEPNVISKIEGKRVIALTAAEIDRAARARGIIIDYLQDPSPANIDLDTLATIPDDDISRVFGHDRSVLCALSMKNKRSHTHSRDFTVPTLLLLAPPLPSHYWRKEQLIAEATKATFAIHSSTGARFIWPLLDWASLSDVDRDAASYHGITELFWQRACDRELDYFDTVHIDAALFEDLSKRAKRFFEGCLDAIDAIPRLFLEHVNPLLRVPIFSRPDGLTIAGTCGPRISKDTQRFIHREPRDDDFETSAPNEALDSVNPQLRVPKTSYSYAEIRSCSADRYHTAKEVDFSEDSDFADYDTNAYGPNWGPGTEFETEDEYDNFALGEAND